MNTYVTGSTIRQLREAKGLTQAELAGTLSVSAKTISKWETAKGLPDISLLEPLAAALGVSVLELMQGEPIINRNRAANLLRSKLYVCPLCGNVLHATGQAVVSCCGITLPALDIAEAEDADEHHQLTVERVEDELFVTLHHPMEKNHYISFLAYLTGDKLQLVKLYPEGDASARFSLRGAGVLYFYCNCHGLMKAPDFRTATRRTSPQKIHLREPDEGDREQVMAYREEFLAIGSRMDGTSALDKYADFDAWLAERADPITNKGAWWDAARHLILPSVVLATIPLAVIARMTRSSMLEVLREDYVRTARAKGLSPLRVVLVHALRNALIPVLTVIGLQVGTLMGGAVLTETIFSWPGVGKWLIDAISRRDYPVVQNGILLVALLVILTNFVVDMLYGIVNPRIRHAK